MKRTLRGMLAAAAVSMLCLPLALGAQRVVLGEEFTATT